MTATIGCLLTVNAYVLGENWYQDNPNVYVDGNCVGTAPVSVQVSPGYHTITVDDPTPDGLAPSIMDSFAYMSDNNGDYYNGQSILISYSDTITAWYYY